MVANDEKIRSSGLCQAVSLKLQHTTFSLDLILITLSRFNVVLEINWLRTLNPITWSFKDMQMSFVFQVSKGTLCAIPKSFSPISFNSCNSC